MRSSSLLHTPVTSQKTASLKGKTVGVIEKRINSENYLIKTPFGPLILRSNTNELSAGDRISISFTNNSIHLEKSGLLITNVELRSADSFSREPLSNFKRADLVQTLRTSLQSGTEQDIAQDAKRVLTILQENQTSITPTEKKQLRQFIAETEKLISQKNLLPKETVSTLQKIIENLRTAMLSSPEKSDPVTFALPASSNIKEGLYSVTTLAGAAKLLDINDKNTDIIDQLEIALKTNGQILLRVLGDETTGLVVSVLTPGSTALEISSFLKTLKSPLLQSLPLESIETVLSVKNNITFDELKNLDSLLKNSTLQFPDERAGSRGAAIGAAANWLYTALDTEQTTKISASQTAVIPAQKIIYDIENINNLLSNHPRISFPSLPQPGITEEQLCGNEKQSVIPLTIQKLGYDLESNIKNNENSLLPSLKKELLSLRHILQNDSESYPYAESSKERQTSREPLSVSLNKKLALPLKNLIDHQTELNNQISFHRQLHNQISIASQSDSLKFSESIVKNIQRITSSSLSLLQSIQNLISTGVNADHFTKDQSDQINSLMQILRKTDNTSEGYLIDLQKRFSSVIDILSNRSENSTEKVLLQKGQSETPQSLTEKQPNAGLSGYLPTIQSTLSQTIESSLGRLESLQLLARQIPVPEGQQQMLALPIKIGNEWTEVNVRFLKQKSSQKKKNPQSSSFSVSLNLAPKQLGPISVKMDYIQKKSLKVAMNFEFESTKNYFLKFSDEIKNALKSLGLPLFSMDITQKKDNSNQKEATLLDTLIDMKV